jgi:hypothetical protein
LFAAPKFLDSIGAKNLLNPTEAADVWAYFDQIEKLPDQGNGLDSERGSDVDGNK